MLEQITYRLIFTYQRDENVFVGPAICVLKCMCWDLQKVKLLIFTSYHKKFVKGIVY